MNEQILLKELKKFVRDYELLEGLKQIVENAKKDKNGNYHSETDGKFISKYSYEAQQEIMNLLDISTAEFMHVVSLINTEYRFKYKNIKEINHYTPDFIYFAENHGFNNYLFYDKMLNEEINKDL